MIMCRALSYEENTLDKSRLRKNTLKAMPIRKVIRTVSTIPMTVGVEEILSVPLGNSLLQTSKRAKLLMSL